MINISLDVGRLSSVLETLRSPAVIQRVANAAAESYNDDIHDWIDSGRGFTPRTAGGLEQSVNWHPNGNGSATVYTNKDYAGYVEEGTRAHVIRPRNRQALRFAVRGGAGWGFARVINHPGSDPHPFFFADQSNRSAHMQAKALSVLARTLDNG